MSRQSGARLGAYVLEERLDAGGASERWSASEPGVDRSVVVTVSPLPSDPAEREAARARLRRRATLENQALPPVYGAGEEGDVAWVAFRRPVGPSLAAGGAVDEAAIAALRDAVAALARVGIAPSAVAPEDVVVEGGRPYLLPRDSAAGADDAAATRDIELLPRATPARRRRLVLALAAVALAVVAAIAAAVVVLSRDGETNPSPTAPAGRIAARIPLDSGDNGGVAVGAGFAWVLGPRGLLRVDTGTNQIVGTPLEVAAASPDAIAFDGGSAFVAIGMGLVRLDPATGRVVARRRLLGAVGLAADGGSLYANVHRGPGRPGRLVQLRASDLETVETRSLSSEGAFSVEAASDVVWTVNSPLGDVDRFSSEGRRTIVAGSEPISVAVAERTVWVANPRDGLLLGLDPASGGIRHALPVGQQPFFVASADDALWLLDAGSKPALYRLDPVTGRPLGAPLALPPRTGPGSIAVGEGAVWVVSGSELLRIEPAPNPGIGRVDRPPADRLGAGPVPPGRRLTDADFAVPLSLVAPSARWFALVPRQPDSVTLRWRPRALPPAMVGVDAPRAVFTASGSVRPVGTAEQFLAGIRANDTLEVVSERRATLGGQPATRIVVRARPRPPYFPGCPTPCSLLFPLEDTTVFITPDSAEVLTVADRAGRVLVAQWSRDRSRPEYLSEARAVIDSIRFVDR